MLMRTYWSGVHSYHMRLMFGLVVVLAMAVTPGLGQDATPPRADNVAQDPATGYLYTVIPPAIDIRPVEGIDERDRDARTQERTRQSNARRLRSETNRAIMGVLDGSIPFQSEVGRFASWFRLVIFAEMNQLDDAALADIPKNRQRFFSTYMQRRNMPPAVHAQLVALTLQEMRTVVKGNYHPAARINAMIIIGRLNERENVSSGGVKLAPVPLRDGLIELFTNYTDENQIDIVRVTALGGIRRHASLDGQFASDKKVINPDIRNPIIREMLTLLSTKEPPIVKNLEPDIKSQRTMDGHRWMQYLAVEILGGFRDPGPDGAVAAKLDELMSDESYPMDFRCTAARAYAGLNFAPETIDATDGTYKLASLISQGCRQEIERLIANLDEEGHDDLSDVPRRVDAYYLNPSRRIVKQYVLCAQEGVGLDPQEGLRRHVTDENKKVFVDQIAERLGKLMQATDLTRRDERDGKRLDTRRFKAYVERQLSLLDQELVAFKNPGGAVPGGVPGEAPGPGPLNEVPADALPPGAIPGNPGFTTGSR